MGDDTGVGGPRGDGRGQKWTPELCKRRLSLMHRKLRQVKDLLAKQAREPGSLDAAQLVKVDRKMDLQVVLVLCVQVVLVLCVCVLVLYRMFFCCYIVCCTYTTV